MIYFLKKIFNKFRVYFFYLINHRSRNFFFILISRKIFIFFQIFIFRKRKINFQIINWCKEKKILEDNFYKKIGLIRPKSFFEDHRSYYFSAKIKHSKVNFKMGGMAHLNLIYNLTKYLKPSNILETGVAFGWSTLVFMLAKSNKSTLTSIDLEYPRKNAQSFVAMALPQNLKNRFTLYNGIDSFFLKKLKSENKFYDLIHYDSDKSYFGRIENYKLMWSMLKKKGCFISDDISDNLAFYDFILLLKKKYYILNLKNKFVGVIFK